MKKFLSLLLSLCLLLCALPMQVLALPGSIFPSEGAVKTVTLDDGSLSLQNEYIHMTFRKLWGTYAYLTVAPAAKPDEESILIEQAPRCTFITYDQSGEKKEGVVTEPIKSGICDQNAQRQRECHQGGVFAADRPQPDQGKGNGLL